MSKQLAEFIVRVHEEDGGLWAEVLDLPGCFASGDNLDELKSSIEEAISLYLTDEPKAGRMAAMVRRDKPSEPQHLEVGEMRVKVPA